MGILPIIYDISRGYMLLKKKHVLKLNNLLMDNIHSCVTYNLPEGDGLPRDGDGDGNYPLVN